MNGSSQLSSYLAWSAIYLGIARPEHYSLTVGWSLRFWLMFQNRRPAKAQRFACMHIQLKMVQQLNYCLIYCWRTSHSLQLTIRK